jgi:hypothetical protein
MLGVARMLNDGKLQSYETMRTELGTDEKLVFVPRPSGRAEARIPLAKKPVRNLSFQTSNTLFRSA